MDNTKIKKLLDPEYIKSLKSVVDHLVLSDEELKAKELSSILSKAIKDLTVDLKLDFELQSFYDKTILTLNFISLPLQEIKTIGLLIKNNFCFQFNIEDYDIRKKINKALIFISDIEERNIAKMEWRKNLLENSESIVSSGEKKEVRNFLKDYISQVGLDPQNKLDKAQYLMEISRYFKEDKEGYNRVVILLDVYDQLSTPSDTPEGFEEELPIVIDGRLYIFRRGILEPVAETPEFKKVYSSESESLSEEAVPIHPELTELEEALKTYSPNSLEYRAIQQEIDRLSKK